MAIAGAYREKRFGQPGGGWGGRAGVVSVASITAEIRRPPWLKKAARTGFAVLPGLPCWAVFGDARGSIPAFGALCISVTYGAGVRACSYSPWRRTAELDMG